MWFSFLLNLFLFLAVVGLLSSCGPRASLLLVVVAFLLVKLGPQGSQASGVAARGLGSCFPRLWRAGSVVGARGLSCSMACGMFPDQGLNQCLLHCKVDSQPVDHQGRPLSV